MEKRLTEPWFFRIILLGLTAVVVFLVLPFLNTLILAAITAFLLSGPFEHLIRYVRSRTLAALLMTLVVLVALLLPLSFFGYRIAQEATALYSSLRGQATTQSISTLLDAVQRTTKSYLPAASLDAQALSDRMQQVLGWLVGNLGTVFTGVTRIVLNFFFFLLFFFYLLRDGSRLKEKAMKLSPLSSSNERQIVARVGAAINGTVRGQILLALLQGLVAGTGYWFFGVPNPALWGSIVVIAAFIPLVGATLINAPVILYLLATGSWSSAIGLTIYALLSFGILDNIFGPKLIGSGARLHPMVALIAVLGGIEVFGPMGILMGPILVSALFSLYVIYFSLPTV